MSASNLNEIKWQNLSNEVPTKTTTTTTRKREEDRHGHGHGTRERVAKQQDT